MSTLDTTAELQTIKAKGFKTKERQLSKPGEVEQKKSFR